MNEEQRYSLYQDALGKVEDIFKYGYLVGFTEEQIIDDITDKIEENK